MSNIPAPFKGRRDRTLIDFDVVIDEVIPRLEAAQQLIENGDSGLVDQHLANEGAVALLDAAMSWLTDPANPFVHHFQFKSA